MAESFTLSLQAFAKKAPEQARQVVRKVSIDILSSVVQRSPVGNPDLWAHKPPAGYSGGRFRANWNVSLVDPDTTTTDDIDQSGSTTVDRGSAVIGGADGVKDICITNSLPYAIPIEMGHSGVQAPQGVVRVTVAEFQQYVNRAAAEANSEQ
ncbi:hypothetical protein ACN9MB_13035 [Dyella kyungheensis]|uniref:hypothetical protein n=1 Tax=Dyella kyungheensis TaxID=1242174 RepID=UPI003CF7DCE6